MAKEIFAHTSLAEREIHLTWKIENFLNSFHWQGSTMTGPDIIMPTHPEVTWKTCIVMLQWEFENVYEFQARPSKFPQFENVSQIEYELSFQDQRGKSVYPVNRIVKSLKGDNYPIIMHQFGYVSGNGANIGLAAEAFNRLFKIYDLSALLVNNDLKLKCCFKVTERSIGCHVTSEVSPESDLNCLSDNFRTLYSSKTLTDFTIVVKDRIFPVHKCVLSSRSPVFAAMFNSDTLERNNNKLVIEDFDTKTMETFILYVYTGQLSEVSAEEYFQLYSAADKYDLISLSKTCARKLINFTNVNNVCDVYALGYYHSDAALMSAAKMYMSKNISSVLLGDSWRKITSQNPVLASEMLKEASVF